MLTPYTENAASRFTVGQRIRFRRADGVIAEDTVRARFWQIAVLQPYAENLLYPALVLTEHSWCAECEVL